MILKKNNKKQFNWWQVYNAKHLNIIQKVLIGSKFSKFTTTTHLNVTHVHIYTDCHSFIF